MTPNPNQPSPIPYATLAPPPTNVMPNAPPPPSKQGFLAKRPNQLTYPQQVQWVLQDSGTEVTTGAPQKLFRYVIEAVTNQGYTPIPGNVIEPQIAAQALGDTGQAKGWIYAEKPPINIQSPWNIIRIAGVITLLIGLIIFLMSLFSLNSDGGFIILIIGIIIIVIGAFLTTLHRFESHVIAVIIQGEVYKSGLSQAVGGMFATADSQRASVVSELRIHVHGSTVISYNKSNLRLVEKCIRSQTIDNDWNAIRQFISVNILPKVVLQTSQQQAQIGMALPGIGFHSPQSTGPSIAVGITQQPANVSANVQLGDVNRTQDQGTHDSVIQTPVRMGVSPSPIPQSPIEPSQETKFCHSCGTKIPFNAVFCVKCGGKQ